jgi:hypothetical protein
VRVSRNRSRPEQNPGRWVRPLYGRFHAFMVVSQYPAHAASSALLAAVRAFDLEGCFSRFGVGGSDEESWLAVDRA